MRGKFIFAGAEKIYIKGVTYGTFRSGVDGDDFPDRELVERDFAQIAENGINAVRTYTVPPRWLLDAAERHGLYVMVGIPWEQHVTFLDDEQRAQGIEDRVRAGVRACAGHPAVLCYTIGNEIPSSIVRWYGAGRIERFLERLYRAAKDEDPDGLVSYVNFPSTEYLHLPFLDFASFNVYLESPDRFEGYLARLHTLAGDRPLVMGEIGLDSRRNGEQAQAEALDWQVRTAFAAGCAGAFVFAWTDEWHRGGHDILDWDFGLTDRERQPKPALATVRAAFDQVPFPADLPWPKVSVVICSYNGARTIADCFEALRKVEYPWFEIIVVDDGSTDDTAAIAQRHGGRVIRTENRGLSSARNTGLYAAAGEIVAYLDDDAYPDPHWLVYLASTFMRTLCAAAGGPNLPPPDDGPVADCVANAPGGPIHVLLSDEEAEHVPGCNLAVRKACLKAIGGFDPQFRVAGDDVDVCWRLQDRGWQLGFSPAAVVWHHRRNSIRAYWRQQCGYGKAEALLERKWPEKYNAAGHLRWAGRIYSNVYAETLGGTRRKIFHGTWGSALFQSVYQAAPSTLWSLFLMPEWHLVIALLAGLSIFGLLWEPLFLTLPVLGLAAGPTLVHAGLSAAGASFASAPRSRRQRLGLQALTALLHLLQPVARLWGRQQYGLTPWRWRGRLGLATPWPRLTAVWSERWQMPEERLQAIEAGLRAGGGVVRRGGEFDRWDLELGGGLLGSVRLLMTTEEHGDGKQMVRLRSCPRCAPLGLGLLGLFASLAIVAGASGAWAAAAILGVLALLVALWALHDCASATAATLHPQLLMERGAEQLRAQQLNESWSPAARTAERQSTRVRWQRQVQQHAERLTRAGRRHATFRNGMFE